MQVNLDLLRQRAQDIRNALAALSGYGALPQEQFLTSQQVIDAAKYRLVVAIEAAVSICTHLAARLAQTTPESYAQCFGVLASAGLISGPLAERLGRMARFRNLLVHGYGAVDDTRVWEILCSDIRDLDTYLSEISQSLKQQLP
jgi:uncharacterized protein YutE (UPF0331/DUF86 family)